MIFPIQSLNGKAIHCRRDVTFRAPAKRHKRLLAYEQHTRLRARAAGAFGGNGTCLAQKKTQDLRRAA
jgi:hypothetical protein